MRIILLIILGMCLLSCKKTPEEVRHRLIPEAMKASALFQKGSYWVYQDDSTGIVDCTYIQVNPTFGTANPVSYEYIDFIQTPLQSSLFSQFYISTVWASNPIKQGSGFLVKLKKYSTSCGLGKTAYAFFGDTVSNRDGYNDYLCDDGKVKWPDIDFFKQMGYYLNFQKNGYLFDSVTFFRTRYTTHRSNVDTLDTYFSPGTGIVKLVLRADTSVYSQDRITMSWSILRWHVVQEFAIFTGN